MFVMTRDGVYVDYNAKDESLLFVPPSRFLGRTMREILPPALSDVFEEKFRRLFAGEEPVLVEYEIPLPSGEVRCFEARVVRCESDKILSIIRDVTAQKRAQAELHNAQLELLRASKLATLGEFAASIAHELAQPLTAIIANSRASLRLLDRDTNDLAEVRRSLHDVLESSRVARDVIHHTRHLFGHGDPEQAPIDLAAIVNEVCMMVTSTLAAVGRQIRLRGDHACDVLADIGERRPRAGRRRTTHGSHVRSNDEPIRRTYLAGPRAARQLPGEQKERVGQRMIGRHDDDQPRRREHETTVVRQHRDAA
jgi:PAS domain S-box-containing protein